MTVERFMTGEDLRRAREILNMKERKSIAQIVHEVAESCGLTWEQIVRNARHRDVVQARQMAMYIAYREGFSTPQIGAVLNRDHTTILHGIKKERARRATNA